MFIYIYAYILRKRKKIWCETTTRLPLQTTTHILNYSETKLGANDNKEKQRFERQ